MTAVTEDRVPPLRARLSGEAMGRMLIARSRSANLTLTEFLLAIGILTHGFIILPGYPDGSPMFVDALRSLAPLWCWSLVAIATGAMQVAGIAITWLGFRPPVYLLRSSALYMTAAWFWLFAFLTIPAGTFFGTPTYVIFAILAMRDLRNASLAHYNDR